jgi:renalase
VTPAVVVVGAGIAGVACAREVVAAGVPCRVLDRGHRIGGRMAVRTVGGRPVDVGASYFTAADPAFLAVVHDWVGRGLVRPWTDTFRLATPEGLVGTTTGPLRYAAPGGLRSLVEDLARGLAVEHPVEVAEVTRGQHGPKVDGAAALAVVLAMPDPQALDLLALTYPEECEVLEDRDWEPVLTLYAGWARRCWPELDAAFVNDSPVLTFVADDGRRRGDDAPVLVAHSDPVFAAGRLDDPSGAGPPMLAELAAALGRGGPHGPWVEPAWAEVKRWALARPERPRAQAYHLGDALVGLCGDGWAARSRIEAAFLSGRALGRAVVERLR